MLAHSDVAPTRKKDPGEKFPWARLARAGIGHWVEPQPVIAAEPGMGIGVAGPLVADVQLLLRKYGYGIEATGVVDGKTEFVVTAFQRHFRPARVDGRIDQSTITTLGAADRGPAERRACSHEHRRKDHRGAPTRPPSASIRAPCSF